MLKVLVSFFLITFSVISWSLPSESNLTYKNSTFSYFASFDLKTYNRNVERAIITIHGSERNAHTYYGSVEMLANQQGKSDTTLIISPHFKLPQDTLIPKELTFTDEGWLRGDASLSNRKVTSFEVMDHIFSLLADTKTFPHLKTIVIAGHSAGGQFVQRYAGGSRAEDMYPHVALRYVVANPGSYMYLSTNRPVRSTQVCAYNDYKYGLNNLNLYMKQSSIDEIRQRYIARDVVYLIGENDTNSDDIDQTCPAQYQGQTRLERGKFFKSQLDKEFPTHRHQILTVPGVGHTQFGMYTSSLGTQVLFQEF